jgi:hypothetical protein
LAYTLRYKKSYDEWVSEKARRIHDYLKTVYRKDRLIDFQELASSVYREGLIDVPKWRWEPKFGFFLDKKPSAFIKNFIEYLCERLRSDGFLDIKFFVEADGRSLSTDDFSKLPDLIEQLKKELETLGITEYELHIKREARLLALPSLDYLVVLCFWSGLGVT